MNILADTLAIKDTLQKVADTLSKAVAPEKGMTQGLNSHISPVVDNLIAALIWTIIVGLFVLLVYCLRNWKPVRSILLLLKIVRHGVAIADPPPPPPSSTPPPHIKAWNLPVLRNPNFTGREDVLKSLQETWSSGKAAALYGLGGKGKTQTAAEFAWRNAANYDVVWWVRAEKPELLSGDFSGLAEKLGFTDAQMKKTDEVRVFVQDWLRQNGRWLIIFDNAEKPEDIRDWLPQGPGHVLITSRYSAWKGTAEPVDLQVWPPAEAVEFLCKRTKCEDGAAATELAKELGYLPLAQEQAAAYIEATATNLAGYLRLYRQKHTELFKPGFAKPTNYPDTVLTTWAVSFERVKSASPAAIDLMNLCAFLAPDNIPREMLSGGGRFLPRKLRRIIKDENLFNETVAALKTYSLLSRKEDLLSVHRMVQAVVRDQMRENQRKLWAKAAVRIVNDAFPQESRDIRTWPICARLMNHVLAATEHKETPCVAGKVTGRVLNQLGIYALSRADYSQAQLLFERALKVSEIVYGANHPCTATTINNLGIVLHHQGNLQGAKECFERALPLFEKRFGSEHADVASLLNNLGGVLQTQKELNVAKDYYQRALNIGEKCYPPDHPKVAIYVNNLGSVLQAQRDFKGAKECFERALKIKENYYGEGHPETALTVNNIGGVLFEQGDKAGAKKYHRMAYDVFLNCLGPDHPHTKLAKRNLDMCGRDARRR